MLVVGVLQAELRLRSSRSLKDKRRVARSVKDRMRARYNVSVAEVDDQDVLQSIVLEAMACRRSVICSPQAANGIRALPGRHLLVADSPKAFARYTLALMRDDHYRQQVAAAARRCVQRRYSWPHALEPMIELLGGTGEEWGAVTPPLALAA